MKAYWGIFLVYSIVLLTWSCTNTTVTSQAVNFSLDEPIGGGTGYSNILSPLTNQDSSITFIEVDTKSDLLSSLANAGDGMIIYISDGAQIDLTGDNNIRIPENVTVAGNRGQDGSDGPLLYTTELKNGYLFNVRAKARIAGVRIKGPDPDIADIPENGSYAEERSNAKAMALRGQGIVIDNCEISNFQRAGLDAQKGAVNLRLVYNYLHDIHAYPIVVTDASRTPILIQGNRIEWVWHAVAGTGGPKTGYEAAYNIIVRKAAPKAWEPYSGQHALDMHADNEIRENRGQLIGGGEIKIHHNKFDVDADGDVSVKKAKDVFIRGVPTLLATIYDNHFVNSDPKQAVVHKGGNVFVFNNYYGPSTETIAIADESTPQIIFENPPPPSSDIYGIKEDFIKINFQVNVVDNLTIKNVIVLLDTQELHNGKSVPKPGSIQVLRNQVSDNEPHFIKVVATDNRGVTSTQRTYFRFE